MFQQMPWGGGFPSHMYTLDQPGYSLFDAPGLFGLPGPSHRCGVPQQHRPNGRYPGTTRGHPKPSCQITSESDSEMSCSDTEDMQQDHQQHHQQRQQQQQHQQQQQQQPASEVPPSAAPAGRTARWWLPGFHSPAAQAKKKAAAPPAGKRIKRTELAAAKAQAPAPAGAAPAPAPANVHCAPIPQQQQQQQPQQRQRQPLQKPKQQSQRPSKSAPPPTAAAAPPPDPPTPCNTPAPRLSRAAAATTIQAAYRGWRLARARKAQQQLAAAHTSLAAVQHLFERYTSESSGSLTHKQYLECQELATRVLLSLDAITCGGAVEFRAVRKRLVIQTDALLNAVQAAYSRAVNNSMQE